MIGMEEITMVRASSHHLFDAMPFYSHLVHFLLHGSLVTFTKTKPGRFNRGESINKNPEISTNYFFRLTKMYSLGGL
jgi:hypothetical protein